MMQGCGEWQTREPLNAQLIQQGAEAVLSHFVCCEKF
jgi:hypothetical protein